MAVSPRRVVHTRYARVRGAGAVATTRMTIVSGRADRSCDTGRSDGTGMPAMPSGGVTIHQAAGVGYQRALGMPSPPPTTHEGVQERMA